MGSTQYIKNIRDDPGYLGKFWVGGPDHYRYIFFVYPISQPIIDIMTQNFQHMILGVYFLHQEYQGYLAYLGTFWVGGHDHYRSIFFVYPISQPKIKIMTRNFQDMILGVYPLHQECHG